MASCAHLERSGVVASSSAANLSTVFNLPLFVTLRTSLVSVVTVTLIAGIKEA